MRKITCHRFYKGVVIFFMGWQMSLSVNGSSILTTYSFSKHRQGKKLDQMAPIKIVEDIESSIRCVGLCMRYGRRIGDEKKMTCKAVNFSSHGKICELLPERICDNGKTRLTDDQLFSYFDVEMDRNQVFFLDNESCKKYGECSAECEKVDSTSKSVIAETSTAILTSTTSATISKSPSTTLSTTTPSTTTSTTVTPSSTSTTTTETTAVLTESSSQATTTLLVTTTHVSTTSSTAEPITTTKEITSSIESSSSEGTSLTSTISTIPEETTELSTSTTTTPPTTSPTTELATSTSTSESSLSTSTTTAPRTASPNCKSADFIDVTPLFKCLLLIDFTDEGTNVCKSKESQDLLVMNDPAGIKDIMNTFVDYFKTDLSAREKLNILIPILEWKSDSTGNSNWEVGGIKAGSLPWKDPLNITPDDKGCCIMEGKSDFKLVVVKCQNLESYSLLCENNYTPVSV